MKPMRSKLRLALGCATLSCSAAFACGEAGVEDEKVLSSLSASELGELCDEAREGWPSTDDSIECDDGSTVTFVRPPNASCGDVDFSTCPATVGDLRACTRAFMDDPCAASRQLPAACQRIEQAGCGAASASGDVDSMCPSVPAAELEALAGVYELMSHSKSEGSCAAEGGSVLMLDAERLFVVVESDFLGRPAGVLQSCSELAECRAKVAFLRGDAADPSRGVPELQQLLLCASETPGAVIAHEILVGSAFEGTCNVSVTETTATRSPDGTLRLESRTFTWQMPPVDEACSYVAGERPSDAACTALEVREARLMSSL